jgi:hypothetical protein
MKLTRNFAAILAALQNTRMWSFGKEEWVRWNVMRLLNELIARVSLDNSPERPFAMLRQAVSEIGLLSCPDPRYHNDLA